MIQLAPQFQHEVTPDSFQRSSSALPPRIIGRDLLISAIALLSNHEIDFMNYDDLQDAVRISVSLRPAARGLQGMGLNETQLRRLLYLLRRQFRLEMDRSLVGYGWQPYFREVM